MKRAFTDVFKRSRSAVIGMVHLRALPGTPRNSLPMQKITDIALKETQVYADAGLDGIIIENMHDLPYQRSDCIGPEIVAAMSSAATAIKKHFPELPAGVQVLKAGNRQSLAVAHASGCDFIRAECLTFSHISDAGWIDASAGDLLRYRRQIGAENVLVFTDVKKKHSSHAVTSDIDVIAASEAAEFFLSDGLILTGSATGKPANCEELPAIQASVNIPVLIGSGITTQNVGSFIDAHGMIVGSHFKTGGLWSNDLDQEKVKEFMVKVKDIRGG